MMNSLGKPIAKSIKNDSNYDENIIDYVLPHCLKNRLYTYKYSE